MDNPPKSPSLRFGNEQFLLVSNPRLQWLSKNLGETHLGIRMRHEYLQDLLKDISKIPNKILDVGCGKGQTSFWLMRHFPDAQITGIDIDEREVEHCKLIMKQTGEKNGTFKGSSIQEFGMDEKFDLIICMDVIEHIKHWKEALLKMIDLLSPGGTLIVHTPHRGKYQSKRFGFRRFQKIETHHVENESLEGAHHHHEGFDLSDFDFLDKDKNILKKGRYSFGHPAMLMHTLFELYRERSFYLRFLLTPLLHSLNKFFPSSSNDGGVILIFIKKRQ
jgi:2-polyprenyl-3-methyl-5-hydroxy-6-metoxy-1,4-benzoquinol methylase